ncbi:sugar ABC transporter ATP-binding protein [Cohnella algarum]|uniref:sugar ABC transporter ATP-binding protein n=1 Tax=Cohnella algarum TaxID=2044859 RepID=UPI001967886D|nr:sugar ABC transporter ATP-binding protein [Cohnella algarum]MBN2981861.1 sugar ABC transporter ATP-binding protein [Cohnella algarum]
MEAIKEIEVVLQGTGLTKRFFGNTVLEDVSIACKRGTVLALVGENGAGKSTLMNILTGSLAPDGGTIAYKGQKVAFRNPQAAKRMGIAIVHQELSLLPELSVGENMLLGREPTRFGLIRHRKLHERAGEVLKEIGFEVDANRLVKDLSPAEKQMVEIAKAWLTRPSVLILDEPTSSLSKTETEGLFRMVRKLKAEGTSLILITHRMDEIFEICDEAVVLKDGRMTKTDKTSALTKNDLIQAMVGREITQTFPPRSAGAASGKPMLKLADVHDGGRLRGVSLEVPRGAIVGVGGLEGQGQRQLARGLFGIDPFAGGEIALDGETVKLRKPEEAIARGIAYIPDDRKLEGLVLPLSVRENMSMMNFGNIARRGIVSAAAERREVERGIANLAVKTSSMEQIVRSLSGGNQQKVIFAKWLYDDPKLLILHEPTRGIDIQSKVEIYRLLRELADRGVSILLFTSDMLELIGLSDRIYVMYEGTIAGAIAGEEATEEKIMTMSSGQAAGDD